MRFRELPGVLAGTVRRGDNEVPAGQDEVAEKVRIEAEVADEAAQPSERSIRGRLHG